MDFIKNLSKQVSCAAILILNMEDNMQHFQHIMFYYFKKGKNATETQKKICGEGAMINRTCQKWFAKFHAADFLLDGAPWSGRPVEVNSDQTETLIENNKHYIMQEIHGILKISKS